MQTRRVAIYARQSLDRSGEGLAVRRQLEDCRALVERNGWRAVAEFVDNDVSATSGRERPQYRKMIDAVKASRVDSIVAWAPDRLARRPRDLEDILDLAEKQGIMLATVSGDVDLSTPYGRAIARIFGAIARQETEQKGARQRRANQQRAQAGKVAWTRRPFGYTQEDGRIVVVEAEAAVLLDAASRVLAGVTLMSLVGDLNSRGIATSTGRPFTIIALKRALLNPRIAGLAAHRGEVVGPGDWPAILDVDVQERLSAKLRDPSRRTQISTNRKYLLSGLVRCGKCGGAMFASPMGQRGGYWMAYKCRRTHLVRRLDLVDEVVTAVVVGRLSQPDAAALLTTEGDDAEKLRERSVQIREQLDQLASLLAEGVLTPAGVRKASEKLRAELESVERQRASLGSADALATMVTADDVAETWLSLSLDEKRSVIDLLVEATVLPAGKGIRFSPDQVQIRWKGPGGDVGRDSNTSLRTTDSGPTSSST